MSFRMPRLKFSAADASGDVHAATPDFRNQADLPADNADLPAELRRDAPRYLVSRQDGGELWTVAYRDASGQTRPIPTDGVAAVTSPALGEGIAQAHWDCNWGLLVYELYRHLDRARRAAKAAAAA